MPIAALRLLPTWARLYRPPRLLSLSTNAWCVCVCVLYTQERREKKKQQKRTRPPSSGEPQELVVVEKNMCHYKYLAVLQESHWEEKEEGDPFVFHIRPFFFTHPKIQNPRKKKKRNKRRRQRWKETWNNNNRNSPLFFFCGFCLLISLCGNESLLLHAPGIIYLVVRVVVVPVRWRPAEEEAGRLAAVDTWHSPQGDSYDSLAAQQHPFGV